MSEAPDALGPEGRGQLIARQLAELQRQRFQIEMMQVANGAADGDRIPTTNGSAGETPPTYAEQIQRFKEAEARLLEKFPEEAEAARTMLSRD
jgi:hypothetical protein